MYELCHGYLGRGYFRAAYFVCHVERLVTVALCLIFNT